MKLCCEEEFEITGEAAIPQGMMLAATSRTRARALALMLALSLVAWLTPLSALAQQSSDSASQTAAPRPRLTPRLRPRPAPPAQQNSQATQSPKNAPAANNSQPAAAARAPAKVPPPAPAAPLTALDAQLPPGFYPPLLPAYRDMDPPLGYVKRVRRNWPLLIGGAFTLAVTYGASIAYGSGKGSQPGMGSLAIPVLGPWLALGKRKFDCDVEVSPDIDQSTSDATACFSREAQAVGVLVGLGVGQLVGTVLLTAGILDRRVDWLRADLAGLSIQAEVAMSQGFQGLLAKGRF